MSDSKFPALPSNVPAVPQKTHRGTTTEGAASPEGGYEMELTINLINMPSETKPAHYPALI